MRVKSYPHGRVQRDSQNGGDRHRQVFDQASGLKRAPFLIYKRKDRQKGNGNDQKRKKYRRADLF